MQEKQILLFPITKLPYAAASEIGASTKDCISITKGSTRTEVRYDIRRSNSGSCVICVSNNVGKSNLVFVYGTTSAFCLDIRGKTTNISQDNLSSSRNLNP